MRSFNINHYVYVQLTDHGREILKKNHVELVAAGFPEKYEPIEETEDGWSKWQLWHLMGVFGESMQCPGANSPFATTINFDMD